MRNARNGGTGLHAPAAGKDGAFPGGPAAPADLRAGVDRQVGRPASTRRWSTIDRGHDRIGVTPAQELSWRRGVVERLHLRGIELDGLGSQIFFQVFAALGAGDGHDVVAFVEQPGQRDLSRLCVLGRCDLWTPGECHDCQRKCTTGTR